MAKFSCVMIPQVNTLDRVGLLGLWHISAISIAEPATRLGGSSLIAMPTASWVRNSDWAKEVYFDPRVPSTRCLGKRVRDYRNLTLIQLKKVHNLPRLCFPPSQLSLDFLLELLRGHLASFVRSDCTIEMLPVSSRDLLLTPTPSSNPLPSVFLACGGRCSWIDIT